MTAQGSKCPEKLKAGCGRIRGNIARRFLSGWFRQQNNGKEEENTDDGPTTPKIVSTTSDDNMSSNSQKSHGSNASTVSTEVVCVFSCQSPKNACNKAYECLQLACKNAPATKLNRVAFEKLDFGETQVLDMFYGADIVVVDMTVQVQQRTLFYHLGVRESFGMERNMVLYNDDADPDTTNSLTQSCHSSGYMFIPYKINNSTCYVCDVACVRPNSSRNRPTGTALQDAAVLQQLCPPLTERLQKILEEVHISNRSNAREVLLSDIRKARTKYKGLELGKVRSLPTIKGCMVWSCWLCFTFIVQSQPCKVQQLFCIPGKSLDEAHKLWE